jgi:glyoxylase-like metal-dependent hydrolase (beta-lactamase superfamily II)
MKFSFALILVASIIAINTMYAQENEEIVFSSIDMGCNVYIVGNEKTGILIDAGSHGKLNEFKEGLNKVNKPLNWIKYIIITHTHYDHVANLAAINELTGAEIIIQKDEACNIESGHTILPEGMNGWGKTGLWLVNLFNIDKTKIDPVNPDIRITHNLDLNYTGLNLEIIHTPGHSPGSISIIWNDTIAFCGDAAYAMLGADPWPETGTNPQLILNSWKVLLNNGCTLFYPGHGKKFDDKRLRKSLEKHINKISKTH